MQPLLLESHAGTKVVPKMVKCHLCNENYSESQIEFHMVGVHGVDVREPRILHTKDSNSGIPLDELPNSHPQFDIREPRFLLPRDNSGIPLDKLPNSLLQGNFVCVGEGDTTGSMVRSSFYIGSFRV